MEGTIMPKPTRPLIGLNAEYVPAGKLTVPHLRLNIGYFEAVTAAGGLPIVLPPLARDKEIDDLLGRVHGVVLTGGPDMDPRRNGQPQHQRVQPMDERREVNDKLLIRGILKRRMPVLAIGLGMQEINVALGGTLYLHLPEDLPRALPHTDRSEGPHRHALLLEPNSRIEEIYGGGEIRVNSAHHQAVRQVGKGLRVGATAPDGVVEAVEATDTEWFCIGVQWHPEADSASALDTQLFECFVQACLRQAEPLAIAA
jgi:putative glutamine amidotransferase